MTTQAEKDVTELLSQAIRIVRVSSCSRAEEPDLIGQVLQALVLHEIGDNMIKILGEIATALENR